MLKAFNGLSAVLAVFSLACVWEKAAHTGLGPTISALIERYRNVTHGIARLLEQPILWLLDHLSLRVDLNEHWIHIAILLKLYFLAHVTSALRDKLFSAAWFYTFWGAFVALFAAVWVGTLMLNSDTSHASSFWIPVLAVAIFAGGNTLRSATWYRRPDQTWWQAFAGPMRHVMRFLLIAALVFAVGILWRATLGNTSNALWGILLLFLYTLALALYRIWVNQKWVRGSEDPTISAWQRMLRSRQAHIGWGMLATLAAAGSLIILGVGENILAAPP
jgi:hypothetical protein